MKNYKAEPTNFGNGNFDIGGQTIDFEMQKDQFLYEVFEILSAEIETEMAINIINLKRENIRRLEDNKTADEVVMMLKENFSGLNI